MQATQNNRHTADFIFSDEDKNHLTSLLLEVTSSPFDNYPTFLAAIQRLANSDEIPDSLREICNKNKERNFIHEPYVYLKNCPVDKNLPLLDWKNPREQKLLLKKTNVGEGFLVLYSELTGTPTLAYRFGGNGDYIRDVHPSKAFQKSHTSQTLTSFGFHKELPIRDTSPDFLRIMGLRSNPENEILTTFVKNIDIINYLDDETLDVLHSKVFHTPFTVLSVNADKSKILGKEPENHAIINNSEVSYHEGRTEGTTPESKAAILKLNASLKVLKKGIFLGNGDFVDFANKYCLHAKDVNKVENIEAVKQRWLIKTFNAYDIKTFEPFFVKGRYGLVNG
jgi:L-asparagine oxygenase